MLYYIIHKIIFSSNKAGLVKELMVVWSGLPLWFSTDKNIFCWQSTDVLEGVLYRSYFWPCAFCESRWWDYRNGKETVFVFGISRCLQKFLTKKMLPKIAFLYSV